MFGQQKALGTRPMKGTITIKLEILFPGVNGRVKEICDNVSKYIDDTQRAKVHSVKFSKAHMGKRTGPVNNTMQRPPKYGPNHSQKRWYINNSGEK